MHVYLDERNRNLWNKLNKEFEISIKDSDDSAYGCYSQCKSAIIYIPNNSICIDSFTHELLHLYLPSKGIHIIGRLKNLFASDHRLIGTYNEDLINHIGNCLEHVKMLPIYLTMNFQREKFIQDYFETKGTVQEIKNLGNLLVLGSDVWKVAMHLLIAKFFSMKACPNPQFDYNESLETFRMIDKSLYDILNVFWTAWTNFDIEKYQPVLNDYTSFCYDFVDNLADWAESKNSV